MKPPRIPASRPITRTSAIWAMVDVSPALSNFASVSERRRKIEDTVDTDARARLVDCVALGLVVVNGLDQLQMGRRFTQVTEPVLHVVEGRESDRREQQSDQQAERPAAGPNQRDRAAV